MMLKKTVGSDIRKHMLAIEIQNSKLKTALLTRYDGRWFYTGLIPTCLFFKREETLPVFNESGIYLPGGQGFETSYFLTTFCRYKLL